MDNFVQYFLDQTTLWAPKIIASIVILVIFFILAKIIQRIISSTAERLNFDGSLTSLFSRASSIMLIIIGFITALGTLGINVSALVAGLGLTGFAFGFALKDTISNLLSGILILLYRPFVKGNRISISGYEGFVVAIDLRYTELDSEGNKVLIPNSKLFKEPITVINVAEIKENIS
ncbi:MAG: mechanosensitive ion channel [Pseudomonadota bacterium]